MTVLPPTLVFTFFLSKIKLKDRHFDIIDAIEAESQAMLNTITEHDFQDAFKNVRNGENGAYARCTTSWAMVASTPKVSFRPDGSTSPRNFG
jgi:hypothetical protein